MQINQLVKQAANTWKLEELCVDLSNTKQICQNSRRKLSLTGKENDCLCGLLCELSVQQIANLLKINYGGLRVELSRGLYRYIEELYVQKNYQAEITARQIPLGLEELGYKRIEPPLNEERASFRIVLEFSQIDIQQLEYWSDKLKQIPGNASMRLERIERNSIVLVFNSTQAGIEQIQALFRSGELTELLGVPVQDVRVESAQEVAMEAEEQIPYYSSINLFEWLQNNFVEATQAGWQTIAEIFSITTLSPAFRSNAVQRAKEIQLGDRTLALILDLEVLQNQQISIFIGVYPLSKETYLPEDLKIVVFFDSGEPLEFPVNDNLQGFSQEILFSPEEQFSVQVTSGDDSVTEDFVI
ncbi:DUF1822 family protein [Floridanema aerugineum]|uniref:DUF1822 family protein n=1 Tax=Floridaenema aerugineum BLCC-F46 TaxID=3153654 RepID=A0ABV4X391_9CYAN